VWAGSPGSFGESSHLTTLPHRRHIERAPGERSQEFGLRFGQVKPGKPVLGTKHHDLAVMTGNDVRSRRGRQHRERWRVIAVPFPPNSRYCCDRRLLQREARNRSDVAGTLLSRLTRPTSCRSRRPPCIWRLESSTPCGPPSRLALNHRRSPGSSACPSPTCGRYWQAVHPGKPRTVALGLIHVSPTGVRNSNQ
jgi:hypothetical protein